MIGRRVSAFDDIEQPGDYCYALVEENGTEVPNIWFLLPIARDEGVPNAARAIHRVASPPHKFRFCDDGSIEVRESIGAGPSPYYWHGYLDEGHVWREV